MTDVKPENVLVAEDAALPRVKLADFGIARLAEEAAPLPVPNPAVAPLAADGSPFAASLPDTTTPPDVPNFYTDPLPLSSDASDQDQSDRDVPLRAAGKRLARPHRGRALTQTGIVMGTPGYMAPELLHGASLAQPAADIYSLGVIAVEMFTGKRPTAGRSLLIPSLDDSAAGASLHQHCPSLEAALVDLITRALAADPDVRPTAQALVLALRAD